MQGKLTKKQKLENYLNNWIYKRRINPSEEIVIFGLRVHEKKLKCKVDQ